MSTVQLFVVELVLGSAGYVGVFILGARLRRARDSLVRADAAIERQRKLLQSTIERLEATLVSLGAMTARFNEADSDRQLLLAEAGAHRAVEMAASIPGLTDEERRAIGERLAAAKAASPKARIR